MSIDQRLEVKLKAAYERLLAAEREVLWLQSLQNQVEEAREARV